MGEPAPLTGPDLAVGIAESDLDQTLLGHAHGEAVLLARDGGNVFAVGATCTHYSGPLAEGLVENGRVHCPWHHACFDLADGHPHGPAMAPIACFDVRVDGGKIRVGKKKDITPAPHATPQRVVIVGGGAAGIACATELKQQGHTGSVTIVSTEESVDRPNLSKDYLAGNAPEEWVFLAVPDGTTVVRQAATGIEAKQVVLADGTKLPFDALLLATGAEPIHLSIPGAERAHVLRTFSDSKAIAKAEGPVAILGASFIALEVAAALKARGLDVTVIAPDKVPLARVLGDAVGAFVQRVHEGKGVSFLLGRKPTAITADAVTLDDGSSIPAKTVVMGVGVVPRLDLATSAGCKIDKGVVVDDSLLAAPGVWAAGDIARVRGVRIEHWQVAVRHGQAAARAMLGLPNQRDVPFFWSAHHDATIGYVGHAESFDKVEIDGDLDKRDALVRYFENGKLVAAAGIGRDKQLLELARLL